MTIAIRSDTSGPTLLRKEAYVWKVLFDILGGLVPYLICKQHKVNQENKEMASSCVVSVRSDVAASDSEMEVYSHQFLVS